MFKKILDSVFCGLFSAMGAVCCFGLSIFCLYMMNQLYVEEGALISRYFSVILSIALMFVIFAASILGVGFSVGTVVFPVLSFLGVFELSKGNK